DVSKSRRSEDEIQIHTMRVAANPPQREWKLYMIRFALEELAASRAADKLAVASGDLPADGDDVRSAFNGQAFEGVVVNVHLVGFGGNGALVAGVIDHEVGVAAQLNRSLAREQT